ncbi:MAG: hypothetical protein QFB86_01615 [Patescibacteria group bacterium]|nr:hypothetical protein [Patescibacteria group bacterium]
MKSLVYLGAAGFALFAALPATTNYKLNSYSFGAGGVANTKTTTYSLEGSVGEISGKTSSTANATVKPGFTETQQANVPQLSALDNGSGVYYNKLHFVIDSQNNPTDATYLIAVSTDNFASNIAYVQSDGTLTGSISTALYQTYAAWGGASGSFVIGLNSSTTYSVKLKATQGDKTESAFGPALSQATAAPSITFNLVTSAQSSPPFSVGLGALDAGTINSSTDTINTTLSTNGTSGGDVYIKGKNGALLSSSTGSSITAASNDLTGVASGFGAQNVTITQTTGGPFSVSSPYNVSGNNVGILSATARSLYTSTVPVTGGAGTLRLKAKAASTTVAANDYQEILTFIAAGNF